MIEGFLTQIAAMMVRSTSTVCARAEWFLLHATITCPKAGEFSFFYPRVLPESRDQAKRFGEKERIRMMKNISQHSFRNREVFRESQLRSSESESIAEMRLQILLTGFHGTEVVSKFSNETSSHKFTLEILRNKLTPITMYTFFPPGGGLSLPELCAFLGTQ